ncbi:hypothetical protein HID58_082869, partial [Brassica napus]
VVVLRLKQRGIWGRRGSERTKVPAKRMSVALHKGCSFGCRRYRRQRQRQLLFVSLTQEAASDAASERRVLRLTPIKPANIVILQEAAVTGQLLPIGNDPVHHAEKYPTPPAVYSGKHGSIAEHYRMYVGYDTRNGKWLMIHGLDDVCTKHAKNSRTIQLVYHGGKLVIVWHQWNRQREHKSIWCAVISLEQRLTPSGNMLWGKIEWCNVISSQAANRATKRRFCGTVN